MIEDTFVMVKPDAMRMESATQGNYFGSALAHILMFYQWNNLEVVGTKILSPMERKFAEEFYQEHRGRPYFEPLIEFMISGPVALLHVRGEDAIAQVRDVNGATDPTKAKDGTIRKLYGRGQPNNAVHGSDSLGAAQRELKLMFGYFFGRTK